MDVLKFKSNGTKRSSCVILLLSTIPVLLTLPASTFAGDDNAVALLRQIGRTFAEISEKASPAVVVLKIERSAVRGQLGDRQLPNVGPGYSLPAPPSELPDNYRPIRPDSRSSRTRSARIQAPGQHSLGLGFIVSEDGHILTCNHLVDGAQNVLAKLADGREFEAEVVGTDPDTDIAVLKIDANELPVLRLGDSDALIAGNWVVGIGNAMGLGRTFAAGLVTAKGRMPGVAMLEDLVQTSINLQKGDTGGPLLDLDGNVVGINIATLGAERSSGISFAIPAGMAKGIYEQLTKTGIVERGFLGIAYKQVDARIAEALRLEKPEGVIISDIVTDSAAEQAGLRKNDILLEFNGKPIESVGRLLIRVAEMKPGTQVEVVIFRGGERQNLTVTLGKRPPMKTVKTNDTPNAP